MSPAGAVPAAARARVTLTPEEMMLAAYVGVRRRVAAIHKMRGDRYGTPGLDLWGMDIEAACAELAVSKVLDCYWSGALHPRPHELNGDVGSVQVRYTPRDDGSLILHPADPDEATFYLVTGRTPLFTVRGSLLAAYGKRPEWWKDGPRPAYFVPQASLSPP